MVSTIRFIGRSLFLVSIFATIASAQTNNADSVWKDFREIYPYHIQSVWLTEPDTGGHRVLIIAEPPPHVTLQSLQAVDPFVLQRPITRRHRIGYDGWVEDVLFELPSMSSNDLKALLDKLHHHLYGTTYKASALFLPAKGVPAGQRNLDLRVPAGEIGDWLLGDIAHPGDSRGWLNMAGILLFACWSIWSLRKLVSGGRKSRHFVLLVVSVCALYIVWAAGSPSAHHQGMLRFSSVLGGDNYTGRQILDNKTSGVFLSEEPGIVLWSFSRRNALDHDFVEAREFTLDSDVIIGAVASDEQVIILGRERSLPVDLLPPLRTETIFQLASANTDELAQSYERTHILAGKFDGTHDWAPIYLSQMLVDTEYGSLLNITDQILKSWSMHGLVRYINFHYPDPEKFPFPTDLMSFAHTNQVTFNWNTKGVGYTTKSNAYEVFALHRTGALPVDYLSADNSELQQAEEDAYGYFAALNDPNLVRVVQYAGLYQIFRRFGVSGPATAPSLDSTGQPDPPDALRIPIAIIIERVRSLSDDQIDRLRALASRGGEDTRYIVEEIDKLSVMRDGIQELERVSGDDALRKLVDSVAAPRVAMQKFSMLPASEKTENEKLIIGLAQLFQQDKELLQGISGLNLAKIKDAYVSESSRTNRTWIRTPSIVLSWPEGKRRESLEGGHNLDAKITQFRLDSSLTSGEIRVIEEGGQKVILHSASDADKAPELVRLAARNEGKTAAEIEDILKRKLPGAQVPERPLQEVLAFTSDVHPAPGRGYQPSVIDPSVGTTGWKLTRQVVPERQTGLLKILASPDTRSVIVSRQGNGSFLVAHGSSKFMVESADMPSAVDAAISCIKGEAQGRPDVKLYLAGFEPRQGKGFARSIEVNLPEDAAPKITATIEGEPIAPDELSRILNRDYKLEAAKITEISSAGPGSVDVELTVPATEIVRPSLVVRLKIWFETGFTATTEVLASIRNVIESWQAALSTAPEKLDLILARKKLMLDLKSVHPEIRYIDVTYSREGKDLFYGASNRDSQRGDRITRQPV